MNEEERIRIKLDDEDYLEVSWGSNQQPEAILRKRKEAKERYEKLKKELFYTVPEGFIMPKEDGTYEMVVLTEIGRKQLAKGLWPSIRKTM